MVILCSAPNLIPVYADTSPSNSAVSHSMPEDGLCHYCGIRPVLYAIETSETCGEPKIFDLLCKECIKKQKE